MRILILNADYPPFLEFLYANHSGLAEKSYSEQYQARVSSLFGVADAYVHYLQELGHEAWELHTNNRVMQSAWLRENMGVECSAPPQAPRTGFLRRLRRFGGQTALCHLRPLFRPLLRWLDRRDAWLYDILRQQIRHFRPDIILNYSLDTISSDFFTSLDVPVRLLVGQTAAPILPSIRLDAYGLMISSLPNYVYRFRQQGLRAELHCLGFDPRILQQVESDLLQRTVPLSFVGTVSASHRNRVALLEHVAERLPLEVWGQGVGTLSLRSPIRRCHRGSSWGRDMFTLLGRSCVTLNHHIGIAEAYCNNMRLFESTGMGAALVTDRKKNLTDYFKPGEEVLAYGTPEECADMVRQLIDFPDQARGLAEAGQARTLRDHNYRIRMAELCAIFERYL